MPKKTRKGSDLQAVSLCRGCGDKIDMATTGFRCLECRWIRCRGCAAVHFGFKRPGAYRPKKEIKFDSLVFQMDDDFKLRIHIPGFGSSDLDTKATSRLKSFLGEWAREERVKTAKQGRKA